VGTCGQEVGERVRALLRVAELPEDTSVDEERVLSLLLSDKKRVAGKQRYILPLLGGGVVMRDDVPDDAVLAALRSVNRAPALA
jgi:3-dehydroquinate synthetase